MDYFEPLGSSFTVAFVASGASSPPSRTARFQPKQSVCTIEKLTLLFQKSILGFVDDSLQFRLLYLQYCTSSNMISEDLTSPTKLVSFTTFRAAATRTWETNHSTNDARIPTQNNCIKTQSGAGGDGLYVEDVVEGGLIFKNKQTLLTIV
jgi:hypothetical protein